MQDLNRNGFAIVPGVFTHIEVTQLRSDVRMLFAVRGHKTMNGDSVSNRRAQQHPEGIGVLTRELNRSGLTDSAGLGWSSACFGAHEGARIAGRSKAKARLSWA